MWKLFKQKPLLTAEDEQFQIETYRWLLTYFGGKDFYEESKLILPTKAFFPDKVNAPEEAAQSTFMRVKQYAGLSDWPCQLQAQEEDPNLALADTLIVRNSEHSPHGTFVLNDANEGIITYNPKLTSDPVQMVATFAHELAHYLTSTAPEAPPGGWENWEFATDIAATFLGFGIFQANSVFNFRQFTGVGTQGWQTQSGGYLSESEHSYALGIFLKLQGMPIEAAYPYCDKNIKALLKRAFKALDEKPHIDQLRQVQLMTKQP